MREAAWREEMRRSGEALFSPAGIVHLQRFGIGSQIVKNALYLSGRRVACSSSGVLMHHLVLSPPDLSSPMAR